MSFLRWLPKRWQRRIRNYAPRGFPDARSCGAFYDARTRLFRGDEAAVLEYSSLEVQKALFERAVALLPPHGRILDVGCGLGHLFDFLTERGSEIEAYHGIDVSTRMLEAARARLGADARVRLELLDLTTSALPERSHDVGYIISVLGYPIGRDPMRAMMRILQRAFDACTDGIAFTHVAGGRRERPLAFPTVPEELARTCERELGAEAEIDDDGTSFTYLVRLRHPG
jgi:SAM-dependent methyltransferase